VPPSALLALLALGAGPILGLAWFAWVQERFQQWRLTRIAAATWLREGGDPRVVRKWKRVGRPSAYDLGRWTGAGMSEAHVLHWQVAGWTGRRRVFRRTRRA
jgi:hypothetical protein